MKNKIIVVLSEKQSSGQDFFQNSVPPFNQDNSIIIKRNAIFDVITYLAISVDQYYQKNLIFDDINMFAQNQDGEIIQYFFVVDPSLNQKKAIIQKDIIENTKGKLIILFEPNKCNPTYLESIKKEYKPNLVLPTTRFMDIVDDIFSELQVQHVQRSVQTALIIGDKGSGKTKLFEKLTEMKNINHRGFQSCYFPEYDFQIVDTPSFESETDSELKEKLLKKYTHFLTNFQSQISTVFLLLKANREDLMKKTFYSIFQKFKNFKNQIVVIITSWELIEDDVKKEQEEDLSQFFLKTVKIRGLLFLRSDLNPKEQIQQLQQKLSNIQGISLNNTIFDSQIAKSPQNIVSEINKQVDEQNEKKEKVQKLNYQQELIRKNDQLYSQIQCLQRQITNIESEIGINKVLIDKISSEFDSNLTVNKIQMCELN